MRSTIEINLTDAQQEAKDMILDYLSGPKDGFILLYGFAGTGKTVTITHTMREYIQKTYGQVVFTAPVNKAVKVLEKTLGVEADYMTIHSLLGLRPKINYRTGEMEFKPEGAPKVPQYDVIVVDESSMLNQDLFDELVNIDKHVIFVGDFKQLRPVGIENTVAAPFRKDMRDRYNIQPKGLLEIIRQSPTSGIIPLSYKIRKNQFDTSMLPAYYKQYEDLKPGTYQDVLTAFMTNESQQDSDYCKVIAYTNRTVDYMNSMIRNTLYNNPMNKIVPGERLIVDEPILRDKAVMYTTNDEVEVQDYDIVTLPYNTQYYKVYNTKLTDGNIINILHEDSQEDYDAYIKATVELARTTKNRNYWREMYRFKETFAQVKYNYAITCHKSQGSTYQHVFMCMNDINFCKDPNDKQALWYTGVTRAAKTVTFI